jgi:osmotically inducible protein OsmC
VHPVLREGPHDQTKEAALHRERPHQGRPRRRRRWEGRRPPHIRIAPPGGHGDGANPEQLFAGAWSACFESAIGSAARKRRITVPPGLAIDAKLYLSLAKGFYSISARLNVSVLKLAGDVIQDLVDEPHTPCPFSSAARGNIAVMKALVSAAPANI